MQRSRGSDVRGAQVAKLGLLVGCLAIGSLNLTPISALAKSVEANVQGASRSPQPLGEGSTLLAASSGPGAAKAPAPSASSGPGSAKASAPAAKSAPAAAKPVAATTAAPASAIKSPTPTPAKPMNPDFEKALNAGIALFNKGKYEDSLADFQKALELDQNNSVVRTWMGASYQKLNRWEDAVKIYEEVVEIDPTYSEGHNNLAFSYQQMRELEKAEEEYKKAIELKPGFLEAHYNLAYVLSELKKYDEGRLEFEQVLKLDPSYSDAYYQIGRMSQELKDYPKAIEFYNKAQEIHKKANKGKDNPAVLAKLGIISMEQGDNEKAKELFEKTLDIDPQFYDAILSLGIMEYKAKHLTEALNYLAKALEVNPYDAAVHFWLGRYYYSLDSAKKAIQQFGDCIKLDAEFPEAKEWLDKSVQKQRGF